MLVWTIITKAVLPFGVIYRYRSRNLDTGKYSSWDERFIEFDSTHPPWRTVNGKGG